MSPIPVAFTFTPDSFAKAQTLIMFRYLKNGWLKWLLLLALALYLITVFYDNEQPLLKAANILLWVPLFVGVWWIIFRWLSRRNYEKYPVLQHPIQYTFDESSIAVKTFASESSIQWTVFHKIEETRDFFFLYQSPYVATPLLKTGFQNETDTEMFRQLLRAKNLLRP